VAACELTVKAPLRGLNYSAVFGIEMHGQPRQHASPDA
jgi:hypothetical protein